MIIDSHCHLNEKSLIDNLDQIVTNAKDNSVDYMQTICTKLSDIDDILSITEKYNNIYCSVGVHPLEVAKHTEYSSHDLVDLINKHNKIIGIGETGLDYYYESSDEIKKLQKDSLQKHIEVAQITQLPLIIHARNADSDIFEMLDYNMKQKEFPALIHCFTAGQQFAKQVLDLGLYISISGIVTFKNANSLKEIVQKIPVNRLLVETDAPYLSPVPVRGKVNEPAYTMYVLNFLAELLNIEKDELATRTSDNFTKLFGRFGKHITDKDA